MNSGTERTHVDWNYGGRPDGFFGTGATVMEKTVVWMGAAILCAVYPLLEIFGRGPDWSWWQWGIVLALVVDLGGGMIANSLNSCKRFYHAPIQPDTERGFLALTKNHFFFGALHVHSILIGWMFDRTLYGIGWYLVLQCAVFTTSWAPLYLRRPIAMLWILAAVLVEQYFAGAIPFLEWFIPVLFLKIVYGHTVREEPYRPVRREEIGKEFSDSTP